MSDDQKQIIVGKPEDEGQKGTESKTRISKTQYKDFMMHEPNQESFINVHGVYMCVCVGGVWAWAGLVAPATN